jgi:hypothetical protein
MFQSSSEEVVLLSDYLEDNKNILTILGVFIAITALSGNLSIKILAAFISYMSFSCCTLILFELWRKPINKKISVSVSVRLFRFFLFLLALGFFLYWFVVIDAVYPNMTFFVLSLFAVELFALFIKALKKKEYSYKFFKKISEKKFLATIFVFISIILIIIISRLIANLFEAPIYKAVVSIIVASSKISGPIQ